MSATVMDAIETQDGEPILDPIERVSEMCFGLFMALTFVGAVSAASSGVRRGAHHARRGAGLQPRVGARRCGDVPGAHDHEPRPAPRDRAGGARRPRRRGRRAGLARGAAARGAVAAQRRGARGSPCPARARRASRAPAASPARPARRGRHLRDRRARHLPGGAAVRADLRPAQGAPRLPRAHARDALAAAWLISAATPATADGRPGSRCSCSAWHSPSRSSRWAADGTAMRYHAALAALVLAAAGLARAEDAWDGAATLQWTMPRSGDDFATGIATANHGALHLEARANYEAIHAQSAFVGGTFSLGDKVKLDATPMVGAVGGALRGPIAGLEATVDRRRLRLVPRGRARVGPQRQHGRATRTRGASSATTSRPSTGRTSAS